MSRERRETVADWLMVLGGVGLLASLFLTWSHQFSAAFLAQWGASDQLRGVPHDPTAWQVYSSTDAVLALVAAALIGVALVGNRAARITAGLAAIVALAFIVHALGHPPTNGANIFDPARAAYVSSDPKSGAGEIVALAALGLALAGLGLSFTAD